jgi:hypothetical protein
MPVPDRRLHVSEDHSLANLVQGYVVLTMNLVDQLCTRWQQLRDVGDRPWQAATLQAPLKKTAAPSRGELRDSQRLPAGNKAEHSP